MSPTSSLNLRSKRLWIFGGLVILGLILLTALAAPSQDSRLSGSTYNRAPDGYGAWYAYMQEQGAAMERWEKPFANLPDDHPLTLLRVGNGLFNSSLTPDEEAWVEAGNRMVLVGVSGRVTAARFSTTQPSDVGAIAIETRRRRAQLPDGATLQLGDSYGAIAWQYPRGDGEVISVIPPYLAANAYQDEPGNFAFLAQLAAQEGYSLLVDEYIHGYKEAEVIVDEVAANWSGYLAQTPIIPALIQVGLILLILIGVNNRRIRPPVTLTPPPSNNSKAYIDALASVLHKAESQEFVVNVIGREEQLQIQRKLGLGTVPVEPDYLLQVWQQHTNRPAAELDRVLRPYWEKRRLSEAALVNWIDAIRAIHQHL